MIIVLIKVKVYVKLRKLELEMEVMRYHARISLAQKYFIVNLLENTRFTQSNKEQQNMNAFILNIEQGPVN